MSWTDVLDVGLVLVFPFTVVYSCDNIAFVG